MSISVATITVAYNEADVLPRQIEALLQQTRPVQEIVIVDNGSTDNTRQILAERFPQVKVLRIPDNPGGVGGAEALGMAYAALEKKHDWIWTFDADSIPEADTLDRLLEGIGRNDLGSEKVAIAAPLLVHRDTGECYPPLFWRDGWKKPSTESLRKPLVFVDLLLGSGRLVRRDVIEAIGLPRVDMHMYFQDFEYCLRARAHGYRIAVATNSRLNHEVGHAREVRFVGLRRLWSLHAPWQEYYMSRNLVYAIWHLYSSPKAKAFCVRHLVRHALGIVFFSSDKYLCLKRMVQGFSDGRAARLGVRFRAECISSES